MWKKHMHRMHRPLCVHMIYMYARNVYTHMVRLRTVEKCKIGKGKPYTLKHTRIIGITFNILANAENDCFFVWRKKKNLRYVDSRVLVVRQFILNTNSRAIFFVHNEMRQSNNQIQWFNSLYGCNSTIWIVVCCAVATLYNVTTI